VTPENLNNRQYQQGQEYNMKPLQVVPALRVNNSSSIQPSRVHASVVGGIRREMDARAGTGIVATYVAIPVQSRSSSIEGHTTVRAARNEVGDGFQNNSKRHVSSSGYHANNKGNSESVSGRNASDDNEVQIWTTKQSFKRGNIEISQAADVHSDSKKSATKDKDTFAIPGKRLKVKLTSLDCIKKLKLSTEIVLCSTYRISH
jgi:hypothetical protein